MSAYLFVIALEVAFQGNGKSATGKIKTFHQFFFFYRLKINNAQCQISGIGFHK